MFSAPILIADDNADLCWLIAGILRTEGFRVDVCHDPDVAIRNSSETAYTAILIEPSPAAGFAPFLDFLESRHELASVVLATTESEDERAGWSRPGVFGVLHKPLTVMGVRAAVQACSQRHHTRDEVR